MDERWKQKEFEKQANITAVIEINLSSKYYQFDTVQYEESSKIINWR